MSDRKLDAKSANPKVLIVYYTYSGNTRKVAHEIHRMIGGDIVEIQPLAPYPDSYDAVVEQAKRELHTRYRPELKARIGDVSSYDTVFVGSPNWWHTIAPPVFTFLAEEDLSGKTIIPFITHGGGGLGRSAEDIAALCPRAKVPESLAVYGADVKAALKWLSGHWPTRQI
jgi:flavodoxin